jgi:hypothetical protein
MNKKRINCLTTVLQLLYSIENHTTKNMMKSQALQTIQLDEISPGARIRFTVINDVQYLSVRDFIICVCNKNQNDAGEVWRKLSLDAKNKVKHLVLEFQFPGRGQSPQPVITFQGSIKLIMFLPGKRVKQCRSQITEIISRYLDGDVSMCDEIKHNHLIGQKRSYAAFARDVMRNEDSNGNQKTPDFQYIYATKSAAFPNLVKIGRTIDIKSRLSQLNTGCAPAPHELVAIVPTMNMYRDEHLTHEHFASYRRAGEFFEVDEADVKAYFTKIILVRYQKDLFESMQK